MLAARPWSRALLAAQRHARYVAARETAREGMTNRVVARSTSNPAIYCPQKIFNKPTRMLEFEAIARDSPVGRSVKSELLTGYALNNRTGTPTHELSLPQRSNACSQRITFFE